MRTTPWIKCFNSFGFITIMVFSFAVLSTMAFSASEGWQGQTQAYTLAPPHDAQYGERSRMIKASRYGESSHSVTANRGYSTGEHAKIP